MTTKKTPKTTKNAKSKPRGRPRKVKAKQPEACCSSNSCCLSVLCVCRVGRGIGKLLKRLVGR